MGKISKAMKIIPKSMKNLAKIADEVGDASRQTSRALQRVGKGAGTAKRGATTAKKAASAAGGTRSARGAGKAAGKSGKSGKRSLPPAIRERIEAGNEFNRQRRPAYTHNEVRLKNGRIMDSYEHGAEIVERKHTQLAKVKPETGIKYLDELDRKYSPGEIIADTPGNRSARPGLVGKPIEGAPILEVPPQTGPIPKAVRDHADDLGIIIRDSTGKEL